MRIDVTRFGSDRYQYVNSNDSECHIHDGGPILPETFLLETPQSIGEDDCLQDTIRRRHAESIRLGLIPSSELEK